MTVRLPNVIVFVQCSTKPDLPTVTRRALDASSLTPIDGVEYHPLPPAPSDNLLRVACNGLGKIWTTCS